MSNSHFVVVLFAFLAGAHCGPVYTTPYSAPIIRQKECAKEGTLRVFRFSDASNTPLFCECKPGFDGRFCEKRVCKNGVVRLIAVEEVENEDSWYPELVTTTECYCNPGFRGVTCEERFEKKPFVWTSVLAILEPIVFLIIFLIPCCCALQMAKEFCKPLFTHCRYEMVYADAAQAFGFPKPGPDCNSRNCPMMLSPLQSPQPPLSSGYCPYTAPPPYKTMPPPPPPYASPKQSTVIIPTVSQPTVSPMRQPVYAQTRIFTHV